MSKGTRSWQRWVVVVLVLAFYAGFRLRSFPQPAVHLSRAVPVSRSSQPDQKVVAPAAEARGAGSGVTLAVCTRLRNEARYLPEWIEFHLLAGVEFFYIYDDSSTDGSVEVLEPYVRAGVARVWTVTDHSHDAEHGQFGHRDECTQHNVMNATWIAMIDADEFLFPTVGYNVTRHLLTQCNPDLSFLMVRWHMYGSNGVARRPDGSLVTDLYRMHSRVDSKICPEDVMGCFDIEPPLSTKLIVNTRCVRRMGTHYVTELRRDGGGDTCFNIYHPRGSKVTRLKKDRPIAEEQQSTCVAPLHLNHYAVKSREDYLQKFQRGRISRGEKDVKAGLAVVNKTTGQVSLKPLPAAAVSMFLGDDAGSAKPPTLSHVEQQLLDICVNEFRKRDFSELLDESAIKFVPRLRERLKLLTSSEEGNPSPYTLEPERPRAPRTVAPACFDGAGKTAVSAAPPSKPSANSPIVFIHIPKCAGTNLNLQLAAIAKRVKHKYCEVRTTDAHKVLPTGLKKSAGGCGIVSGEFDVSILNGIRKGIGSDKARPQPITFLRDPIARTASQFEHHLSRERYHDDGAQTRTETLLTLVSPQRCHQLERRQTERCGELTNPLKCRANGWCGIFQNQQVEILAGAMSFKSTKAEVLRRSGDQLLCTAQQNLASFPFFGIAEHYRSSMCLFFHTFSMGAIFDECCASSVTDGGGSQECAILDIRTAENSAKDSNRKSSGRGGYISQYTESLDLLAAMYDGNRLDCELYASSMLTFTRRIRDMEVRRGLAAGHFSPDPDASTSPAAGSLCERALAQYRRAKESDEGS
mmetsp:Transcript_75975/g.216840  ORF Transcript_75975/g.216840 Transcript_75975/m.216840 type:complete len:806 (-) Transcript_75975:454-2871(-)